MKHLLYLLFAAPALANEAVPTGRVTLLGTASKKNIKFFTDFLKSFHQDDCKGMRKHMKTYAKDVLKWVDTQASRLFERVAKDQPMMKPMVEMGKAYVLDMIKGHIRDAIDDNLCQNIQKFDAFLNREIVGDFAEVITAAASKLECERLKTATKKLTDHLINTWRLVIDLSIDFGAKSIPEASSKMREVKTGLFEVLEMVRDHLVDQHMCRLAYVGIDVYDRPAYPIPPESDEPQDEDYEHEQEDEL